MVGKRAWVSPAHIQNASDINGTTLGRKGSSMDRDREYGTHPRKTRLKPSLLRFRENVNRALEDRRREEIKNKLIEEVYREKFEEYRKSDDFLRNCKNKKVRKFYEDQNEACNDWLEVDTVVRSIADDIFESFDPDADHDGIPERRGALQDLGEDVEAFLPEDERRRRKKAKRRAQWAISVNIISNVILLIAKVIAVFFSPSLSLIASLVDSALDLFCTIIVWVTNKLVSWRLLSLRRRFPVGRRRLEPLGILVFSVIMVVSFAQVLQESVEKLLPSGDHTTASLGGIAIGAMVANIVVKGIVWIGCIPIKTTQVQALAQDCKTDVYFNTLSLLFPLIGNKLDVWWLDPTGATILSLYIIYDWTGTAFENITRLSGSAVEDRIQRRLTFLAYRFSPIVDGFKTITAYHAGDGVWVEVDILLDPNTSVMKAHDISETLQYCLEGLPEVDRAFVTVDYAMEGPSGHTTGLITA
ncbi:uncharacterized protein PV09_00083 [Verruconis gallopava]|uniref:Cation efflux protein transmembrane domain-containing protein n=1 Tax=Verruconis gallopava TaxID=253628 RepID=A0A0D1Z859_9PEZI|nr:uncharacterized protein PV09_00083 [Verruconis gallopava]KIW09147.1 hypothetical protein PV09_00083 [Verruconis gallopava]